MWSSTARPPTRPCGWPDLPRGGARHAARGAARPRGALRPGGADRATLVVDVPLPDAGVFHDAEELVYRRLVTLQRRLTDTATSVRLVTTPERMVIDEARRLYTELSLFEVPCDAVVMNRLLPDAAGELDFFRERHRIEQERLAEVGADFRTAARCWCRAAPGTRRGDRPRGGCARHGEADSSGAAAPGDVLGRAAAHPLRARGRGLPRARAAASRSRRRARRREGGARISS